MEVRDVAATSVERLRDGTFEVALADGSLAAARTVVLATGLRDVMPDVPGFAEQWGRTVHVCPFCHGHELSGKRVAIQDSPNAGHVVAMLSPIAGSIKVVPPVTRVSPSAAGLVVTSGSTAVVVDGLFAHPAFEQAAPFAAQLGLEMRESGAIAIDLFGHTSVPGVYAAGDLAHVAGAADADAVGAGCGVRRTARGRHGGPGDADGARLRSQPRGWSRRYSPGVIPVTVRKSWVKWAWSA